MEKKPKMWPVVKLRDLSIGKKNLYHRQNKRVKLKPDVEVLPANTGGHKKADEDKASKTRADLNTLKSRPRVGPEKSNIRKNPYFMKNSSRFKSDGKKPVEQRPIVELRKIEGKLATALNAQRKNLFYPNSKPDEKKSFDENEPLSKLRRRLKIKRLNAKPSKKGLKKSTFDENEPLSKLRRNKKLNAKPSKKELKKSTFDENEPLSKLRRNKKLNAEPSKKELKKSTFDENEPLSKLRRNKKLNAKPSKKELQKSTFDEDEPLSKLRRNKKLNAEPSKKELKKSTHDEKLRQDEKLSKLWKNPFYMKPSIVAQEVKLLPAPVKMRKLDINSKSLYRKFPKLVVRKI